MPELMVRGVPVQFPFEPYSVQRDYMAAVLESLQSNSHALLESPTGTGKTLCLLCASLAWLQLKKAQLQLQAQAGDFSDHRPPAELRGSVKAAAGKTGKEGSAWGMPKVIYASRTHSQLTQAMQELKRSAYRHMKAAVLGSRDQMCIHPEVSKETNNANKVHMCQLKVKSRTCYFYTNIESKKDDRTVKGDDILDIEDLVAVGKKLKACPYYLAKELKQEADIVFMPYNYLLDPRARKANGVELTNNVIILDEAHNVEKMCEESASLQIRTTDIALSIDEITHVMRSFSESGEDQLDATMDTNQPKDFTCDDLCILKEMMLAFEKAIDEIQVSVTEGSTFPGGFIFDLLAKAEIHDHNQNSVLALIDNLIQFLSTASASPFQRKGVGLQKIADLLHIVYSSTSHTHKERVKFCYKVHLQIEEKKGNKKTDSWATVKASSSNLAERVLSYWCFSPGFGMKQLLEHNVRSIILTSGTLAPLKPLISELGIPIGVQLENPHIVKGNQVLVKIISQGPDSEYLNSNYQNRNNPKYICSLGRTILSFSRVVPDGLLIFFPSYPIMAKCQETWQSEGIWSSINNIKSIFVEPQRKDTFNAVMSEYYEKINDPSTRGACFMAVCRGKVSEGLDFADMNGRAVIITGLPFPPLKDPRIVLKKKYLEELRMKEKDFLSGDEWYSLEATRAVNQAIGRVIRHKNDYGAILLCDTRFNSPRLKCQLSSWLKDHVTVSTKFGETVGEVCRFFKNAEATLPAAKLKPLETYEVLAKEGDVNTSGVAFIPTTSRAVNKIITKKPVNQYPNSNEVYADFSIDFYKNAKSSVYLKDFKPKEAKDFFRALDNIENESSPSTSANTLVTIHKRNVEEVTSEVKLKKRKLKIKPIGFENSFLEDNRTAFNTEQKLAPESLVEFVKEVKTALQMQQYKEFQLAITSYKTSNKYSELVKTLSRLFESDMKMHYLLKGMKRFLKDEHKTIFQDYCDTLQF